MKEDKSLNQQFEHLRQLPLEVSFQQVEQWLTQQPAFELKTPSWWMRLMMKFGFFNSEN